MKFEIQSIGDTQPEGANKYFVVVGGDTGAPWEQKGFSTREDAESAKELMERVLIVSQENEIRVKKALQAVKPFFENHVPDCVCEGDDGCPVEGYIKAEALMTTALFEIERVR